MAHGSVRSRWSPGRLALLLGGLWAVVAASVSAGAAVGPASVAPATVWKVTGHHLLGVPSAVSWAASEDTIVWALRLPRALLAVIVGAGLAVVGVALQALVRNPLADPYLLGVSSGAAVGATAVLLFGALAPFGVYALGAGAFLGALAAAVVVFAVAAATGRVTPLRLVLAGVAVGGVLTSLASVLVMIRAEGRAAESVQFWMLGSLARARWSTLGLPAAAVAAGSAWLLAQARWLDAYVQGDDTAATLGLDVGRFRRRVTVVAALVAGTVVAVSGAIGFVGLMVPHLVRMAVGADHRRVLLVAAPVAAAGMVWADLGARLALAPMELPVGVVTSLVGAPVFVALLRHTGRREDAVS